MTNQATHMAAYTNTLILLLALVGDGTILWLGRIFNGPIPPVISFAMGSLGFLTPFSPNNYQESLSKFILHGGFISMRSRISARIIRNNEKTDKYKAKNTTMEAIQFQALNEAVIDRGPSFCIVKFALLL